MRPRVNRRLRQKLYRSLQHERAAAETVESGDRVYTTCSLVNRRECAKQERAALDHPRQFLLEIYVAFKPVEENVCCAELPNLTRVGWCHHALQFPRFEAQVSWLLACACLRVLLLTRRHAAQAFQCRRLRGDAQDHHSCTWRFTLPWLLTTTHWCVCVSVSEVPQSRQPASQPTSQPARASAS